LAAVGGSAGDLPAPDPLAKFDPAYAGPPGLPLNYDRGRFDAQNRVFFNMGFKPAAERCYYCHTVTPVDPEAPERWERDRDIHLERGLSCADCHRHGLDHRMVRGYEGAPGACAPAAAEDAAAVHSVQSTPSPPRRLVSGALTCRGCHLGDAARDLPPRPGGRLAAPVPAHKGLPPLHLERLTCTACHSGPRAAGPHATTVHTALAHGLGLARKDRRETDPPRIVAPVFMRQAHDNRIAPHCVLWPAFWGTLKDGQVTPLPLAVARERVRSATPEGATQEPAAGRPFFFDAGRTARILAALAPAVKEKGEPVWVGQGKLHALGPAGTLRSGDHPAAQPYRWALAHDVRPATESLGAAGCHECHGREGAIFFGQVTAGQGAGPVRMLELRGESPRLTELWAISYAFRPVFKVFMFSALALLAAVLLRYGLAGLSGLLRWLGANGGGQGADDRG